jgi:hypothetical protein
MPSRKTEVLPVLWSEGRKVEVGAWEVDPFVRAEPSTSGWSMGYFDAQAILVRRPYDSSDPTVVEPDGFTASHEPEHFREGARYAGRPHDLASGVPTCLDSRIRTSGQRQAVPDRQPDPLFDGGNRSHGRNVRAFALLSGDEMGSDR